MSEPENFDALYGVLMKQFLLGLVAALLVSCGGSSSPVAVVQAQSAPQRLITTELIQVLDNVPGSSGLWRPGQQPTECNWAGVAATANTSTIYFGLPVHLAHWTVTVIPNGGGARLVAYDQSDYAMTVLGEWFGPQASPMVAGAYLDLNQFLGKIYKHIGLQVCGDAHVYSSKVEVVYALDK